MEALELLKYLNYETFFCEIDLLLARLSNCQTAPLYRPKNRRSLGATQFGSGPAQFERILEIAIRDLDDCCSKTVSQKCEKRTDKK